MNLSRVAAATPSDGATRALVVAAAAGSCGPAEGAAAVGVVAAVSVGLIVATVLVWRLRVVVPPGHIAVISGRANVTPDGQTRGFRIVMGGSTMRMPFVERCDVLPVGPFRIETTLRNVHTKGAGRTNVRVCARLAVARDDRFVVHAVERFVGRGEAEIVSVGRETLEGAVRGVAAALSMDELGDDRDEVRSTLTRKCQSDLEGLGLALESLDTLEVTEVGPAV